MQMQQPLCWEHPTKRRYYRVSLESDLLDDLVVVRSWGGIGSRRGGVDREVVRSREEGRRLLDAIARRRAQHGYRRIN